MSTTQDIIIFNKIYTEMEDKIHSVIYIGCRERKHLDRVIGKTCYTLDNNSRYNPDINIDLNLSEPIPYLADLIICSNVLMYVPNAYTAINNLISSTKKYLILQEPVIRPRTEKNDLYEDINRFYCEHFKPENFSFLNNAEGVPNKNFIYVGRPELKSYEYYDNPSPTIPIGAIGGLWLYQRYA